MTVNSSAPPDAIITGEGVALELPAATALTRVGSAIIDYGLLVIGWIIFLINLIPFFWSMTEALAMAIVIGSIAVFFWLTPALITGITGGSSLGKAIAKTRVVTIDGGTVTMQQSFIRATVGIAEVLLTFGTLATIVSFASKRGQRLGDMAAGTYVVRWPKGKTWEPDVTMPEQLAEWASLAQTRPLPTALSLNVTDFLRNRERLLPDYRAKHARTLAAACEKYVSPPPPWGTNPEHFLEAVTVVRYDVERRRHERLSERRMRLHRHVTHLPYGLTG
ncbi:RDD family protein [Trueperella bialowiezensis]|uniref:RDD family n=1 Tax=Trueperella bialowiezensis TaxID=312285 RepID=A0A3S4VA13_9ACTO|nr:RDD family protein [Trueperella bialowiezensis]VEI12898.1 RDD family [Trueperella bialowiezensis]